jgi:hypothetical protein
LPSTRKKPYQRSPILAGKPVFRLKGGFDPQCPPIPVSTVLEIVADFILKINLFLRFTAILFNSYFKEKGVSRILIIIFRRKGPRIRGPEDSRDQVSVFLRFFINLLTVIERTLANLFSVFLGILEPWNP